MIFTDLPAGSCTMAARRLLRERPAVVLVTGANLATLLDFVFHADVAPRSSAASSTPPRRDAPALVVHGRSAGGD